MKPPRPLIDITFVVADLASEKPRFIGYAQRGNPVIKATAADAARHDTMAAAGLTLDTWRRGVTAAAR